MSAEEATVLKRQAAEPAAWSRRKAGVVTASTGLRLVLTPVVMGLVLAGWGVAAAVVFAVAAATDYLDGYLARRWRVTTATGTFLDTTADKVLVSGALIALVSVNRASAWVALVIIGRELVIMGLRSSAALRGHLIRATQLGRVKAAVQFLAILLAVLDVNAPAGPLSVYRWALIVAAAVTFYAGADYLARFYGVALSGRGQ